jgi:ATP-dependent Clp protease ATP-binding subunit ClpB
VKPKGLSLGRVEKHLLRNVVGQPEAVAKVMEALELAESGLGDPRQPDGVFVFAGSTGVGKTELARQLAEVTKYPLKRFDMSEYKEDHEYAKLIGSPPGYVGYDEGGQLTNFVRSHPNAIILFDEVEKAHPNIMDLLLQIAEEGELSDGEGRTVDFSQTLIILTTNLGSAEASCHVAGFTGTTSSDRKATFKTAIEKYFKQEFLGRVTAVVIFNPLTSDDVAKIVRLEARKLAERFPGTIRFTRAALARITAAVDPSRYGAREVKTVMKRDVMPALARFIRKEKCGETAVVTVSYRRGFQFSAKKKASV